MDSAGISTILNNTTAPLTPRKYKKGEEVDIKLKWTVQSLSSNWDLGLELPPNGESPAKRLENPSKQQEIVSRIKYLCYQDLRKIDPLKQRFETKAHALYSGWVLKSKAERGVRGVPEKTRERTRPVADEERGILLDCLLEILTAEFNATPKKKRLVPRDPHTATGSPSQQSLNDSTIPFNISKSKNDKRPREQLPEKEEWFKKPKIPEPTPNVSMQASFGTSRSSKISFASNASSIFSNPQLNGSYKSLPEVCTPDTFLTQATPPVAKEVDAQAYRDPLNTSFRSNTQSSEYEGASSFDADLVAVLDSKLVGVGKSDPFIDDELSQDMLDQAAIVGEDDLALADVDELILGGRELRQYLQGVFPKLPPSFRGLPLRVGYEVTRVFLHAGVPLTNPQFSPPSDYNNYEDLWRFLKSHPLLQGKPFPRKCSPEAWNAATERGFQKGSQASYMSGSLRFNVSQEPGPFFRLQLEPLKLDKSHRTGRRFGHDRLFEIDMPSLAGRQTSKLLRDMGPPGSEIIIEWLVDESHQFLERTWKPFHLKANPRKDRKSEINQQSSDEATSAHRIYFFAVDGAGFEEGRLPADPFAQPYVKIAVGTLLNSIRPTRKNGKQSYLKLFSRTSLALSRNVATEILQEHQIIYQKDVKCEGKDMTDGAGRISHSLALKVVEKLGLTYRPSGFQARIGSAKGFWSVCPTDTSNEDWIEIYDSQRKWESSTKLNGESDDPSHRTFEVLEYSKPLNSADLNLQLVPLLIDRAKSRTAMRKAIAKLLEEGLAHEMETLQTEMKTPQSFRKWVREANPTTQDRLRNGGVSFQAGLPMSLEERLNVLLDAGFDAKNLRFMKEMTKNMFNNRCEYLESKLKITIGKSTYVYMVPDFAGVLEEGEVYLDFSSFVDEMSRFSGELLNGIDVLVTRSPAHLVSDVQKVRAVYKVELMGIKDAIVFSTRGKSLAGLLSGGDFDGDKALVIWEKSIVDNFISAGRPDCPDLVQEGYIRKDSTTYEELIEGQPNPESTFLKRAFAFNMQPELLGICTNYKDLVCYNLGRVDTKAGVYLSTLLGDLVDASKQGYIFTEEDWNRFKAEKVKIIPRRLEDKDDNVGPNADHIIDYLKWVAKKTINTALTRFANGFPDPPMWDEDLAGYYKRARDLASQEPQWEKLLSDLIADFQPIKASFQQRSCIKIELRSPWAPYIIQAHQDFQAIKSHEVTLVSQILLLDSPSNPELSSWALLKASAFFASYDNPYYDIDKKFVSNLVWHLAGKQLAHLKAKAVGGMFAVVPSMYAMLKPDAAFVKAMLCEEPLLSWAGDGGGTVGNDELEDIINE